MPFSFVWKSILWLNFSKCFKVPGPVRNLQSNEVDSHHAVLKWDPPDEPNGLLQGYDLGYQKGKRWPWPDIQPSWKETLGIYEFFFFDIHWKYDSMKSTWSCLYDRSLCIMWWGEILEYHCSSIMINETWILYTAIFMYQTTVPAHMLVWYS